jgi:acyl-coenzyme A synthetase/AMP-(fatty) acid ligase
MLVPAGPVGDPPGGGVPIGMNAAEYVLAGGLAIVGPDKPAIVSGGGSVSYGELAVRVSRFAAALCDAGMNPGDRVAMLMLDHADLVALYLATIAAGGVAITVSTRATSDDLRHTFAIVRPFAIVTEIGFAPAVAAAAAPDAKLFLRERDLQSWLQRPETEVVPCARKPDDPAYWVMTSGTTGQPKAVEHRHDNVCACTDYLVHGLAATAADRFLPTSRLNFAYALGAMFGSLRLGATLILHEHWPTPPSIAATVDLHRPSIMLSVPTLFHKLSESGFALKSAFRAVRCYVSAGERLPPRIGVEWEGLTGRPIVDAMSCSELVHKVFTNTLSARRAGSSGRPVQGVEVRLIDRDGLEVTQPGRSGRLEVRAPFLCAGYRLADAPPHAPAHRPAERFRGEWFATGDEYLRDEDGFYHHCGRSDDMLKVAGLWVSPSEIEDALAGIPTIAEAAAVASENAAGLSEIVLYVVVTSSADGDAAIAAARDQLARKLPASKLPRQYALAAELPRTATGKVQRHKLRSELQHKAARA